MPQAVAPAMETAVQTRMDLKLGLALVLSGVVMSSSESSAAGTGIVQGAGIARPGTALRQVDM